MCLADRRGSEKHFQGKFAHAFLILALAIVVGISTAINPWNLAFGLAILSAGAYVLACVFRPFVAFCIFIAVALTSFLSTARLVGNVSVLVPVGGLFVGAWLLRLVAGHTRVIRNRYLWPSICFLGALCVSTALNWARMRDLTVFFTYLQLLVLLMIVVNFARTEHRLRIAAGIIVLTSVFTAAVAILSGIHLLPSQIIAGRVEGAVIVAGGVLSFSRATGFYGDPNVTALQLIIGIPFAYEFVKSGSVRSKILASTAIIVILLAVALTYSLGGLLALASVVLLEGYLATRGSPLRRVLVATLAVTLGGLVFVNFFPDIFQIRVQETVAIVKALLSRGDMASLAQFGSTRGNAWIAATKTLMVSPVWGVGPGVASYVNARNSLNVLSGATLSAHNALLEVGGDTGIVGLFFFVTQLVLALSASRPVGARSRWLRRAIFIALIATSVAGLSISLQNQKILWVLIGMALCLRTVDSAREPHSERADAS